MTARTFELIGGTAHPFREDTDLGAASAALPGGAYTTLRTYGERRVVRMDRHLQRLEESVGAAPDSLDRSSLRRGLAATLRATGHPQSRLRITYAPPRLFATVEPFVPVPEALYAQGAACVTVLLERRNPHAKDTGFLATAEAARRRLPPGTHEGLLVAADGAILEGLSSNFFGVLAGRLHTERRRALAGVTRELVLEVAAASVRMGDGPVRTRDVPSLEECFLTSASRGILPVARIDGHALPAVPGPVTRALAEGYERRIAAEAEELGDGDPSGRGSLRRPGP